MNGRGWLLPILAAIIIPGLFLFWMFAFGSRAEDLQSTFGAFGPVARMQLDLFWWIFWAATFVFIVVEFLLFFAIFRFRARPGDGMPAQGHGNTKLEIAWTIAPAVILAVVAVPTVSTLWKVLNVPDHSNPLEVEVIGRQWWWEVNYPSLGVKTANEIWMPEDRVVHLKLTSKDVLHSFWIPKLGGKTDMIPNHPNEMWLQGDEPGLYYGQCAEFCGEAHALMRFRAVVATQADFDKWVANEKSNAMASTTDIAKRGEAIFMGNTALCWTCHTVTGTKAQGTTGPNLTHVGIRNSIAGGILDNNEQNLAAWLRDPYGVKPGNLMGKVITKGKLSETDIAALVAYLQGLK